MRTPQDVTIGDIGLAVVALIIVLMLGTCAGRVEAAPYRPPRPTPTAQQSAGTATPRPDTRTCVITRYPHRNNCNPERRPIDRSTPR